MQRHQQWRSTRVGSLNGLRHMTSIVLLRRESRTPMPAASTLTATIRIYSSASPKGSPSNRRTTTRGADPSRNRGRSAHWGTAALVTDTHDEFRMEKCVPGITERPHNRFWQALRRRARESRSDGRFTAAGGYPRRSLADVPPATAPPMRAIPASAACAPRPSQDSRSPHVRCGPGRRAQERSWSGTRRS